MKFEAEKTVFERVANHPQWFFNPTNGIFKKSNYNHKCLKKIFFQNNRQNVYVEIVEMIYILLH